jgi:hypothetical protein
MNTATPAQPMRRQAPERFHRLVLGPLTRAIKARSATMARPHFWQLVMTSHPSRCMAATVSTFERHMRIGMRFMLRWPMPEQKQNFETLARGRGSNWIVPTGFPH